MNGIICIDKPQDFTSFDAVAKLRGILKMKRIGHGGTLDPMATGVLPIFLGTATKACDMIDNDVKAYTAQMKFGIATDTLDITGEVLSESVPHFSIVELEDVLNNFRGEIEQTVPMYSAVSVNGQKLYKLARKGITVERPKKTITIFSLELTEFDAENYTASIDVKCSKGTYIRTLIDDIGSALSCGAVMTALRRTASCGFNLDDCLDFDKVKELYESGKLDEVMIPPQELFKDCTKIKLSSNNTARYKNGAKLRLDSLNIKNAVDVRYAIFGFDDEFLGTANIDFEEKVLRIEKNFYSVSEK